VWKRQRRGEDALLEPQALSRLGYTQTSRHSGPYYPVRAVQKIRQELPDDIEIGGGSKETLALTPMFSIPFQLRGGRNCVM
jgi:hypothetical protein